MEQISKNYKPEFSYCPICNKKLKYLYAISDKTIIFTQGKKVHVKNLAYECPNCKNIYRSQTATKFAFKGVKYSTKVCLMIYYYKLLNYSRDKICDLLAINNIIISDRNVDFLYDKMTKYLAYDYLKNLDNVYKNNIDKYNDIKLSIDLISYNKKRLIIIRDFYDNEIIGFYYFNSIEDPNISQILSYYLNKELPISTIFTIRKDDIFVPLLKKLLPEKTKFIAFLKI